jgi:hypothetical protein
MATNLASKAAATRISIVGQGAIMQLLLGGILGANILTMSVMNFLEAPPRLIPPIYFACMAAICLVMTPRLPALPALSRRQHLICLAFAVALFLPRITYLLEVSLGYSVTPVGDDTLHIQHLVSIVQTPTFPPKSTFDPAQYLSYYYAPWMLGAAIYELGILSTIKQALAITVLTYCLLFSYAVMYASRLLFTDKALQRAFCIICITYGGFDFFYWLSTLTFVPSHSAWWALEFGFILQYSNFIVLTLWVQQHTLAALAIFYTLLITSRSSGTSTGVLAGIFCLSALYSSVFVVIGAIPLLLWQHARIKPAASTLLAAALTFFVVCIPLWWLYLGKSAGVGFQLFYELTPFWQSHKRAAFLVFLLVISLQYGPLLLGSGFSAIREPNIYRSTLLLGCVVFLLSTFFVSFTVGNNYAMRGSIVSTFTLIYLATPALHRWIGTAQRPWARFLIAGYFLGGLLEYTSFTRNAWIGLFQSNTPLRAEILRFNEGVSRVDPRDLALRAETSARDWYLLERARPAKLHVSDDDVATMGTDSDYRVTLDRLFHGKRQVAN